MDQPEILEREFLPIRAKLIEIAAALDRIDRADGAAGQDKRMSQIRQAIQALCSEDPGRAEAIQLLFSLPYEEDWRESLQVAKSTGRPAPR